MPCSSLYACCRVRRRSVSSIAVAHRVGHLVGVHDHTAVDVARRAPRRLDQRAGGTQEPFLVGIQNRDQRHLGQVEPFAQQVDADQDVELAAAQIAQDLHALQRFDIRMQVAHLDAQLLVVLRQVLRHALGQRRHQHPFARAPRGRGSPAAGRPPGLSPAGCRSADRSGRSAG